MLFKAPSFLLPFHATIYLHGSFFYKAPHLFCSFLCLANEHFSILVASLVLVTCLFMSDLKAFEHRCLWPFMLEGLLCPKSTIVEQQSVLWTRMWPCLLIKILFGALCALPSLSFSLRISGTWECEAGACIWTWDHMRKLHLQEVNFRPFGCQEWSGTWSVVSESSQ